MSVSGDIKQFSAIDIIQLLNTTKKTGILKIKGTKGESQIVFSEGDFVSAMHLDGKLRIGQVLVNRGAITEEQLEKGLLIQKNAGNERKPLIITLIEEKMINKEEAYKGLEALIEETIVEIMTWNAGHFELVTSSDIINDGYKYFPEKLKQEITISAQWSLMDAVRIFDEKVAAGLIKKEEVASNQISLEMLGLDILEDFSNKIRKKEFKPVDIDNKHGITDYPVINTFLATVQKTNKNYSSAAIIITKDKTLVSVFKDIGQKNNHYVIVPEDDDMIEIIITQTINHGHQPVLVIDIDHNGDEYNRLIKIVKTQKKMYPYLSVIVLACKNEWDNYSLELYKQLNTTTIIPKPCHKCHNLNYEYMVIELAKNIEKLLEHNVPPLPLDIVETIDNYLKIINEINDKDTLLKIGFNFISTFFKRTIMYNIVDDCLKILHTTGIDKNIKTFKYIMDPISNFKRIGNDNLSFFGKYNNFIEIMLIHKECGSPMSPLIAIFPLCNDKNNGKIMIYGDSGNNLAHIKHNHFLSVVIMYIMTKIKLIEK